MTKLTKEDIQFIDNYLDNSEIIYADIRMEMTDHVASEIESLIKADESQSFYVVFKNYMAENKASLLDQNKQFVSSVVNENTRLIFKELISYKTVLIFIVLALLSYNVLSEFNVTIIKNIFAIPLFSMMPLAFIYFIGSKIYNYSRFSGVERLGFMYTVLFQVIHLISIIIKPKIIDGIDNLTISIAFTTCIVLIYVFVKVTYNVITNYLLKYKSIA